MTKFSRLLALVLVVALMANFVVPGLAVDASEGCQCDPELRTGTYLSTVAATCSEYGYDVYVCDDCGKQYSENLQVPTGNHNLAYVEAQEPSCTEIGWDAYEYCEDCQYTTYAAIPATGHTEVVNPGWENDCVNDGYTEETICGVCGEVLVPGDSIPAPGHVAGEVVKENIVAESCTEWGSYDEVTYCTVCGDELSRVTVNVEPYKHYYGYGPDEIRPATCTESEIHVYICLVCEYVLEKPVGDPLGHTAGDVVVENDVKPTCTVDGSYDNVVYCTVCNEELSRETIVVPATGHAVVDATCTEASYCSTCGEVLGEALGHDYKAVVTAPTCIEEGYTTHTCSRCDDSYVDSIVAVDPLAHNHGITKPYQAPTCVAAGWTAEVACFYCGHVLSASEEIPVDPAAHKLTSYEAKDPDCENIGWHAYEACELCDYTTYVEIPALGHDLDAAVEENRVEPTCTTDGSYDVVVYCSVCLEEISRETIVVPALGHSYEAVVTEPTCTEDGYTTYTCTVCGDVYVADVVEALGHAEYGSRGYVDPTCLEDGYWIAKCYRCGTFIIEDKDSALGHEYVAIMTNPTCTEQGYTTYICCNPKNENETCNDTYVADYVPALGHTEGEAVEENRVEPSCTVDGSYDNVVYCTVCGEELSRETIAIPALGHTEGEVVVENLVEGNCTVNHSYDEVVYCTVCGEELSRDVIVILAPGHVVVDPECEIDSYCAVCGEVFEGTALEHVEIVVPGYAPTYDTPGLSDGAYCELCGKVLVEQVVIDPIAEEITFSYKAYGINGSANAVNSGYITVEIWMNVNTDIARLWAVDLDVLYNSNLTLLDVSGCIFEQSLATPLEIANADSAVKLTQDMGYSGDKEFAQGEYLFATLTFKVAKDFYSQDASFIVNLDECTLTRKGEFANELNGDFGTGTDIHVNMLGDANLDGKITSADTAALSAWFETADLDAYDTIFDMNKDGYIDGDDFALLRGAVVRDNSYLDI